MTSVLLYDPVSLVTLVFPITPAEVKATSAAVVYRFSESRRGGISRPRGRQESEYTFSCRLPGLAQSVLPHVHDWQPPAQIIATLDTWAGKSRVVDQRTKLTFLVAEKGINQDVYLGDYSYTWLGAFGDAQLDVHLVEFRALTVDLATTDTTAGTDQAPDSTDTPDEPPVPSTYTVQPGDTLYGIAAQVMGDGGLWQQLYNANVAVIGPSPNVIQAGMVLTIPGGQASASAPAAPQANTSIDRWWLIDPGASTGAPQQPVGGGPF